MNTGSSGINGINFVLMETIYRCILSCWYLLHVELGLCSVFQLTSELFMCDVVLGMFHARCALFSHLGYVVWQCLSFGQFVRAACIWKLMNMLNTFTATDEYTPHSVHVSQSYTGTTGQPAGTSVKLNHTRGWHSGKNWPGSERVNGKTRPRRRRLETFTTDGKIIPLIHRSVEFLHARRHASAGLCDRNASVCLSVCHTPVLCQNEES